MWKSSKFYSKDIKWGQPRKEKKKVSRVLKKTTRRLKTVLPAKRQKRGALKRTVVGKTKVQMKTIKPRKTVTWSKVKGIGKRHEQKEKLYIPYQHERHGGPTGLGPYKEMVGSRGDPEGTQFRLTKAGKLVAVKRRKRRIAVV